MTCCGVFQNGSSHFSSILAQKKAPPCEDVKNKTPPQKKKTKLSPVTSSGHVVDIFPWYGNFCQMKHCNIFSACPNNSFNEIFELTIIYSVAQANGFKLMTRGLSHYCWIRSHSVPHFEDSTNGSSRKPKRYEAKNVQNHIFRKFAELCHELI